MCDGERLGCGVVGFWDELAHLLTALVCDAHRHHSVNSVAIRALVPEDVVVVYGVPLELGGHELSIHVGGEEVVAHRRVLGEVNSLWHACRVTDNSKKGD